MNLPTDAPRFATFALTVVVLTACSGSDEEVSTPQTKPTVSAAERATWGGAEIYDEVCDHCHKMGVDGAPKLRDTAAWRERIAKGRTVLLQHVHEGFGKMPVRGDCKFCSDAQLAQALDYIIEHSQ